MDGKISSAKDGLTGLTGQTSLKVYWRWTYLTMRIAETIMELARSDMRNTLATGRFFLAPTGMFSFRCLLPAASELIESLKIREHRQSPELIISSRYSVRCWRIVKMMSK
jgi:hypothetical protein